MSEEKEVVKIRKFGGKIFTGKEACKNKAEANIQKRHLKAYLKGHKYFAYLKDKVGNTEYYYVNERWV